MHKGKMPHRILEFLINNSEVEYTPKRLSEELHDPRVDLIRRTLNRLVRRGLIEKVGRGKFKYPSASGSIISDAKMLVLIDKIINLLIKECRIPDSIENRLILKKKIEEALMDINWSVKRKY